MKRDDGSKTLRTTTTSLEILELLEEMDGGRISQVADRMDAPKSTVHGHLATLRSKQFVIKRGDVYYLGPELVRLGNYVRTQKEEFVLAREFTERLFEETGFRATFAVEMGMQAAFIHTASGGKDEWAHERLGNRLYLHDTAVGKAILAAMPEARVERIIDERGLPRETENTITEREELLAELETVRSQGYAVNHGENIENLHAIGVAATEPSGVLIGGFSITGPKRSFTDSGRERELADTVTRQVNEYELVMSFT